MTLEIITNVVDFSRPAFSNDSVYIAEERQMKQEKQEAGYSSVMKQHVQ